MTKTNKKTNEERRAEQDRRIDEIARKNPDIARAMERGRLGLARLEAHRNPKPACPCCGQSSHAGSFCPDTMV